MAHEHQRTRLMPRAPIFAFAFLALASAGHGQSLPEIDRREAALVEAWQKTPLTIRRAVFVSKHPDGFGMYAARETSIFKPGERLVTYAEPVGYGWNVIGQGMYEFGFIVDFLIKQPDGKIVAGQQDFAKLAQTSRVRNREFMLTLTLDVTGADPGDYVLEYKLRDITGDKSTSFELPFKIAK